MKKELADPPAKPVKWVVVYNTRRKVTVREVIAQTAWRAAALAFPELHYSQLRCTVKET